MIDTVSTVILMLASLVLLYIGIPMVITRYGYVNNQELTVALAIMMNKVIGAIYVVGAAIVFAIATH